jgi:hypothetical protein
MQEYYIIIATAIESYYNYHSASLTMGLNRLDQQSSPPWDSQCPGVFGVDVVVYPTVNENQKSYIATIIKSNCW